MERDHDEPALDDHRGAARRRVRDHRRGPREGGRGGSRLTLRLQRFTSVDDFEAAAREFLAAREAEHNLLFGICAGLRASPSHGDVRPYFAVVRRRDVVMAALQTPPRNLVLSEVADLAALALLVEDVADMDLPGVLGPAGDTAAFAQLWSTRTGRAARPHMAERIFRLTAVRRPAEVPGRIRIADARDRDVLIEWLAAFAAEALEDMDASDVPELADQWLNGRGRAMYFWDDGGPVSMSGVSGETPHGIRIGPVYTPPERRRRGYASALVAAASQAQLDRGREFCFLFTDLANPTSNHIYQEIGYEPVRDVEVFRFEP